MAARVIRWGELAAVPWTNGLGMTREIARSPQAGEFAWRLSAADVPVTTPFSPLPGIQRSLGVLAGGALDLTIGGETRRIGIGEAPVTFDGGVSTIGAPVTEPVIDLNLMTRAGMAVGSLESIGTGQLALLPGFSAIVALAGGPSAGLSIRIGHETCELGALDAVLWESDAPSVAVVRSVASPAASGPVAYLARVAR